MLHTAGAAYKLSCLSQLVSRPASASTCRCSQARRTRIGGRTVHPECASTDMPYNQHTRHAACTRSTGQARHNSYITDGTPAPQLRATTRPNTPASSTISRTRNHSANMHRSPSRPEAQPNTAFHHAQGHRPFQALSLCAARHSPRRVA
jgi:hypothetical protein